MSEPCRLRRGEGYGACDDEVLGISPSSSYELMHQQNFPALRIGNRIVVPKEWFIQWVERNTNGGNS